MERWAEQFIAKRKARRQQKAHLAAPVPSNPKVNSAKVRSKRSDSGDDGDDTRSSIELEQLVTREVNEWRSDVGRSRAGLRLRKKGSSLGASLDEVRRAARLPRGKLIHQFFTSAVQHLYPLQSYLPYSRYM